MRKKLAVWTLGSLLLISPSFALAQTTDVASQIAALQAQVAQLLALIAQLKGGEQTSCVDLSHNLTLGSTGSDVSSLQNYLIQKGYLDAQYSTGYYGFLTAQAVGKLQLSLGLVSTANDSAYGIMGPRTRSAIACGTNPQPIPQPLPPTSTNPTSGSPATLLESWPGPQSFGAGSNAVSLNSVSAFSGAHPRSVSLWFNTTYAAQNQPLFDAGQCAGTIEAFQGFISAPGGLGNNMYSQQPAIDPGGIYIAQWNRDIYVPIGIATITDGSWHNLVVTYDGNNLSAFVDGVAQNAYLWSPPTWSALQPQPIAVGASNTMQNPILIGRSRCLEWSHGSTYFQGSIANVGVYDGALSASQVAQLFSQMPTQNPVATPTASIDQSALTAAPNAPFTLTGSATGVQSVKIAIGDRNGHNYFTSAAVPVTSGRWQTTDYMGLSSGTYGIDINGYTDSAGTQPVTGVGEGGLITGAYNLTVSSSPAPSATIDQSSLTSTSGFVTVTGTASNVSTVVLAIKNQSGVSIVNINGTVSGGTWAIPVGNLQSGTYSVTLYNIVNGYDLTNAQVLATGTLTVGASQPTVQTTLTLYSSPTAPSYQIVSGGTNGVVLGSFMVQSAGKTVDVTKITLQLSSGAPADIGQVYLYSSGSLIGTTAFLSSNTATISLATPLVVGGQTTLTVKGDIRQVGVGYPGTPGDLISINAVSATGYAGDTGAVVASAGGPVSIGAGVRLFRSYPTIAMIPTPTNVITGNAQSLLRFSITASPAGGIGISQFPFTISVPAGVSLSNVGLYAYSDPGYSIPISGEGNGGVFGALSSVGTVNARFFIGAAATAPLAIPSGATYYFELRGSVSGGSGPFSTLTTLPGDSSYSGLFQGGSSSNGNFQWSPNDQGSSALLATDWTNGYGVPGLPMYGISQTLAGSGQQSTTSPTATIDQSSLTTTSANPTITGTANISTVIVTVLKGSVQAAGRVTVTNGAWSFANTGALSPGTYPVIVTDTSGNTLTTGTLTVNATTASVSAAQMASVLEALQQAITQLRLLLP